MIVLDVLPANAPVQTRISAWCALRANKNRRPLLRALLSDEAPGPVKRHSLGAYPVVDLLGEVLDDE
jgi:hypothetical protein